MSRSQSFWRPAEAVAQPRYRLHTLGWKAFEDLALTVMREILGATVVSFAEGSDGGRDGAYYGHWEPNAEAPPPFGGAGARRLEGPFLLQCKFFRSEERTLRPSDITEELPKVTKRVAEGLCSTYVLLSNARVTADSEKEIRKELLDADAKNVLILAGTWIEEMITSNVHLRRTLPRMYGLGDLTQILDERRYSQAHDLLAHLGDESMAAFVRTSFYAKASRNLDDHGFAILLGAPGAGKSISAVALAASAVDAYGSVVIKVDGAEDFKASWNPHQPEQLFWVDDAFGVYKFDAEVTEKWIRNFGLMRTAVRGGARFIFTSRDYIFKEAERQFKRDVQNLFSRSVEITPARLSVEEREQILYSQLQYGDQPAHFLSGVREHLPAAARSLYFSPEQARRLGNTSLSATLKGTGESAILDFFEHPIDHLCEVLAGLDPDSLSALCLVYMANGSLKSPVEFSARETELLNLIGGSKAGIVRALTALEGSFLRRVDPQMNPQWKFHHPTMAYAIAKHIGQYPELIEMFIAGLDKQSLCSLVSCAGSFQYEGRQVATAVPPVLYGQVIDRIVRISESHQLAQESDFITFLARCGNEFLTELARRLPDVVREFAREHTVKFGSSGVKLLARLHGASLLPEAERESAAVCITREAESHSLDWAWAAPAVEDLVGPEDFEALRDWIYREVISKIPYEIECDSDPGMTEWASDEDFLEAMRSYERQVDAYRNAYQDHPEAILDLESAANLLHTLLYTTPMCGGELDELEEGTGDAAEGERSIFDDLGSL
ncbi:MAG: hypothetical protein WCD21_40490 [Streptomyces sp.]